MDDRYEDIRSEDARDEEKQEDPRLAIKETFSEALQEILRDLRDNAPINRDEEKKEERQEEKREPERELEKDREREIERTSPDKTEELARVLYQRNGAIYLPDERAETPARTVLAAAVALREETGGKLTMSPDAMEAARYTSQETLRESLQTVIRTYQEERGAQYDMNGSVMFKNFPDSVFRASDFELRAAQVVGYLSDRLDQAFGGGSEIRDSIKFDGDRMEREPLRDTIKTEELKVGRDENYCELVKDLIGGRATLSPDERQIVSGAFKHQDVRDIMPERIEQKDNLAYIARLSIEREIPVDRLPLRNATDAMRVGRELNKYDQREERERDSKGREKTSDNGYYRFGNREKKFIYQILERDKNILSNMKGREEEFKALGRGLNGYRGAEQKFPHAYAALQRVSNNERLPVTADGRYEQMRDRGEVLRAADMRKEFPGKFTKELDSLLTQSMTRETAMGVVDRYAEVVDRVPVRSLFIAKNHFEEREEGKQTKFAMPKDDPRYVHKYEKEVRPIDERAKEQLIKVIDRGIKDQLKEREPMGKVYIDPRYKGIPIPKDTRTETGGMRPISKGTRLEIDKDAKCIRTFIHWKGEDLDLSARYLDKDFRDVGHVSYTNLRDGNIAAHSGDITYAPNGASEFIDLRLDRLEEKAKEDGTAYVAFQVNVFRGEPFSKTEECMFGYMERQDLKSGEIYDPRTVEHAFDLKSSSMCSTTMLYDIANRQMIWSDIDLRQDGERYGYGGMYGNIERTRENASNAIQATIERETPSMYDVLRANAEARGTLVDNPRDADVVFGIERDSTAVRDKYGMDRQVEVEVEKEDGSKSTEMQPAQYEYHDMFERASWGSKYM